MKIRIILILILSQFAMIQLSGQNKLLIIPETVNLPDNHELLLKDLNAFLLAADEENQYNSWVLEAQKVETYILLDEIYSIRKSGKREVENFYKAHLNNIIDLGEANYLIQVSYMASENNEILLRAMFELIAHKSEKGYKFSSPLQRNTAHWNKVEEGKFRFYYKDQINLKNVQSFAELATQFDKKLKNTKVQTTFYCAKNLHDVLQLIGVQYKSDYNGMQENSLSSMADDLKIVVLGNDNEAYNEFDPHDLWHNRLSFIASRRTIHRPLDEGLAYLYGGSWGMSWEEIFRKFMKDIATDEKADWMDYKENPYDFGDSKATHLYVDYVINALIASKIESEKGFDPIMKLLKSGPATKTNAAYYQTLFEITGISKDTYNAEIWKLIKQESERINKG